jgi:D-tyrosyl-tRNA(Tyr) deacylase
MKSVIQRVSRAHVIVDENVVAKIDKGLLALVGFHRNDQESLCEKFLDKLLKLRIFEDEHDKMNLSVSDVGGSILLVPQFTLYGDTRKGNRPSFIEAAPPERGQELFDYLSSLAGTVDVPIKTGVFQATMEVALVNQGPVTIVMEM